ncbi:LEAF RUST 10 DISEASE-RESISTANCE LOCUS RECEPTOR-LIKE PROTEIN KINASE-like 1.4 [Impatiens glandulifera]|uniref:LEAF RUST 10 DISEASE-RESISTANCE LOCUS RECEPTOR-LIKE PROTEIN KINASE-like 1.4 n=1 Tax=Impatiens glandulifera TaxID=253017 RepID=UPI001FB060BF|nr:LEAF RUST 10 DISEASE-RESISTANCE LOCUS RECEPTOR-LIKE PROTEIN KINASE-like 1.4 [Impatiens glandulifera]
MNSQPVNKRLHLLSVILLMPLFSICIINGYPDPDICTTTFTCGNITDIGYPFRSSTQPESCGYPGLLLTCQDNNFTTIKINNLSFRVLNINPDTQIMKIARTDIMNSSCPLEMINTTLDTSLFQFLPGINNMNLTFLYNCLDLPPFPGIKPVSGCQISTYDVYVMPGTIDQGSCENSVIVPVSGVGFMDDNSTLDAGQVLRNGFQIKWTVDTAICGNCTKSNGRCGQDPVENNKTICYCPDPPFYSDSSCVVAGRDTSPPEGTPPAPAPPPPQLGSDASNSKKGMSGTQIALFITGAILAGIGLGWIIFAYRQRRKRKAAGATATPMFVQQDKNKDILLPLRNDPTSTTTTPTSSNFSKSITSFTSSKTEFGRSTYFGTQIFSYEELEEATQSFDDSRELGDGGFGTVYFGILQDGRSVAVKRLYENNFKRVEQFMNEVEILTRLRHVNLVTLYGCTSKRSRGLLLVYEFISNGTVADHLHGKRADSGLLSWSVRLNIALETAGALAYLHSSEIIHRDVKTNNILLDNDFRVKVADFGLSRLFPTNVTHVSTAPQGTPGYVDPEYYQCYQLTEKSDVYSFGVVLIELISSKQAVDTNRDRQDINLANMALNKIQSHALDELVDPSFGYETDESVRRMVMLVAQLAFRCLQQDKDMRPTMEEVLMELKRIKIEEPNQEQKQEVVDIVMDDVDSSPL